MEGKFVVMQADPAIQAAWEYPGQEPVRDLNTSGKTGYIMVNLPDGTYRDILNDGQVVVRGGKCNYLRRQRLYGTLTQSYYEMHIASYWITLSQGDKRPLINPTERAQNFNQLGVLFLQC